jgi:hypothetical protein
MTTRSQLIHEYAICEPNKVSQGSRALSVQYNEEHALERVFVAIQRASIASNKDKSV